MLLGSEFHPLHLKWEDSLVRGTELCRTDAMKVNQNVTMPTAFSVTEIMFQKHLTAVFEAKLGKVT